MNLFITISVYNEKFENTKPHLICTYIYTFSERKSRNTLFVLINVPRSQFCRGSVSVQKREMVVPTICLQSSPNCIAIFPRLERGEFSASSISSIDSYAMLIHHEIRRSMITANKNYNTSSLRETLIKF